MNQKFHMRVGMRTNTQSDTGTGTTLYWFEVMKWGAQNDTLIDPNIQKYGSTDHKRPVYSHKMRTFYTRTPPWQDLWGSPLLWPLRIFIAQAVVAGD